MPVPDPFLVLATQNPIEMEGRRGPNICYILYLNLVVTVVNTTYFFLQIKISGSSNFPEAVLEGCLALTGPISRAIVPAPS